MSSREFLTVLAGLTACALVALSLSDFGPSQPSAPETDKAREIDAWLVRESGEIRSMVALGSQQLQSGVLDRAEIAAMQKAELDKCLLASGTASTFLELIDDLDDLTASDRVYLRNRLTEARSAWRLCAASAEEYLNTPR